MIQTSSTSDGSGNCVEGDDFRMLSHAQNDPSKRIDGYSARSQTPRENFQSQYNRQRQQQRNMYKNVTEPPYYFPPFIQDHGRWESGEGCGMPAHSAPRFCPPRRIMEKEAIDLQSLPVLKQPQKNISEDLGGTQDYVSDEKYRAQQRNFPELPIQAHERIRELGNEIVASYAVQLCKFYNDSLVETTPHSFAVVTKKTRTGQRWLMVFRHDRGRVSVKYNKLLTNQLLVRCLNPVSIEVEPARSACNAPQETCVFTFPSHAEASNFLQDVQENQAAAWNHREVLLEQSLRSQDQYMAYPPSYGHFSPRPRPLSARGPPISAYMIPPDMPQLTPRSMNVLPPLPLNRQKRSPFTVSARTPRADLDENWRNREGLSPTPVESDFSCPTTPTSVTNSPMRKRSKGSSKDSSHASPGGSGDFVYNSLTHAMALQQQTGKVVKGNESTEAEQFNQIKDVSEGRRFHALDVLVSNKRDVGTGAPDEEFFSLGSGEIQVVDNGEDLFDEVKCFSSEGQLLFTQILYGWNKVRNAEGCPNPKIRWWIGAAVLGPACHVQNGEAPRIREFKATFHEEELANKFSELFQEGATKGNNPEVRKKYLAQSLRV